MSIGLFATAAGLRWLGRAHGWICWHECFKRA